ncbi:MAG: hypothetical protein LH609_00785 [Rudanella sp.]|nr:hypothetical protein [Rudanella sp.]
MNRSQLFATFGGLTLTTGLLTFVACQNAADAVSPITTGTGSTTVAVGTSVADVYKKIYF